MRLIIIHSDDEAERICDALDRLGEIDPPSDGSLDELREWLELILDRFSATMQTDMGVVAQPA